MATFFEEAGHLGTRRPVYSYGRLWHYQSWNTWMVLGHAIFQHITFVTAIDRHTHEHIIPIKHPCMLGSQDSRFTHAFFVCKACSTRCECLMTAMSVAIWLLTPWQGSWAGSIIKPLIDWLTWYKKRVGFWDTACHSSTYPGNKPLLMST